VDHPPPPPQELLGRFPEGAMTPEVMNRPLSSGAISPWPSRWSPAGCRHRPSGR
jgi:hypothetical protein